MRRIFYMLGNLAICAILVGVAVEFFEGNPEALPLWTTGAIVASFALSFFLRATVHFVEWMEKGEIHDDMGL